MKKTKTKPGRMIVALHAYVGNDLEAQHYVDRIKEVAVRSGKTIGDFVLDAVEAYVRAKSTIPDSAPIIERQAPSMPIPAAVAKPEIDYSELVDPPFPIQNNENIPDSRPKT